MLPNYWYPILFSRRVRQRPVALRRGGVDLVLFRNARRELVCLRDRCPHRGVPLSLGFVRAGRLVCGYHGFEFDGTGACVRMPCEGPNARIPAGMCTDRFPVRERDGIVWMFWGADGLAEATELPYLRATVGYAGTSHDSELEWPLSLTNSLENNFDIHHFNYVHGSQAPMLRVGSLVGESAVELRPDGLDYRANAEPLPGERGRTRRFLVEYRAPSLQAINVDQTGMVTVYDCPIDANTTFRMLRMYLPITIPVVGKLAAMGFTLMAGKYAQLNEDLPFARHVAPPGQDRPVRADAGITAFRKFVRQRLLDARADELPEHVAAAMAWHAPP